MCRGRVGAQPTTHLYAVDARHHDVEQDEVRRVLGDGGECFLTVARNAYVETFEPHVDLDEARDVRVVVDHEDAAATSGRSVVPHPSLQPAAAVAFSAAARSRDAAAAGSSAP